MCSTVVTSPFSAGVGPRQLLADGVQRGHRLHEVGQPGPVGLQPLGQGRRPALHVRRAAEQAGEPRLGQLRAVERERRRAAEQQRSRRRRPTRPSPTPRQLRVARQVSSAAPAKANSSDMAERRGRGPLDDVRAPPRSACAAARGRRSARGPGRRPPSGSTPGPAPAPSAWGTAPSPPAAGRRVAPGSGSGRTWTSTVSGPMWACGGGRDGGADAGRRTGRAGRSPTRRAKRRPCGEVRGRSCMITSLWRDHRAVRTRWPAGG